MDQVLISTEREDLCSHIEWAERMGFGLELQAFADPRVLAGEWRTVLKEHKKQLAHFDGRLGLHGAFYDMISASLDPEVVRLTRRRYRQNLQAAAELGAEYVVFHVNYMGTLKLPNYRHGWHERQVEFWSRFVEEAELIGVHLLLENLWEDEPALIANILAVINHPCLRACLDVAHATLYSTVSIDEWITCVSPFIYCCHLNNHNGEVDLHWPLNQGVVSYPPILEELRHLERPPLLTLEMPDRGRMMDSLPLLQLNDV
jgi:sugar phosphate isomerase/epimerase